MTVFTEQEKNNVMSSDDWEEIISYDVMEWQEVGKVVEGVLINVEEDETFGNKLYHIQKNGDVISFYGTTMLNRMLNKVEVGSELKICYMGEKVGRKGKTYKEFKVYKRGTKIIPK